MPEEVDKKTADLVRTRLKQDPGLETFLVAVLENPEKLSAFFTVENALESDDGWGLSVNNLCHDIAKDELLSLKTKLGDVPIKTGPFFSKKFNQEDILATPGAAESILKLQNLRTLDKNNTMRKINTLRSSITEIDSKMFPDVKKAFESKLDSITTDIKTELEKKEFIDLDNIADKVSLNTMDTLVSLKDTIDKLKPFSKNIDAIDTNQYPAAKEYLASQLKLIEKSISNIVEIGKMTNEQKESFDKAIDGLATKVRHFTLDENKFNEYHKTLSQISELENNFKDKNIPIAKEMLERTKDAWTSFFNNSNISQVNAMKIPVLSNSDQAIEEQLIKLKQDPNRKVEYMRLESEYISALNGDNNQLSSISGIINALDSMNQYPNIQRGFRSQLAKVYSKGGPSFQELLSKCQNFNKQNDDEKNRHELYFKTLSQINELEGKFKGTPVEKILSEKKTALSTLVENKKDYSEFSNDVQNLGIDKIMNFSEKDVETLKQAEDYINQIDKNPFRKKEADALKTEYERALNGKNNRLSDKILISQAVKAISSEYPHAEAFFIEQLILCQEPDSLLSNIRGFYEKSDDGKRCFDLYQSEVSKAYDAKHLLTKASAAIARDPYVSSLTDDIITNKLKLLSDAYKQTPKDDYSGFSKKAREIGISKTLDFIEKNPLKCLRVDKKFRETQDETQKAKLEDDYKKALNGEENKLDKRLETHFSIDKMAIIKNGLKSLLGRDATPQPTTLDPQPPTSKPPSLK